MNKMYTFSYSEFAITSTLDYMQSSICKTTKNTNSKLAKWTLAEVGSNVWCCVVVAQQKCASRDFLKIGSTAETQDT